MIRLAKHDDTRAIVGLLKEFLKETPYDQAGQAGQDVEHLCKIVWSALQNGYIWLAEIDREPVGLLIAFKESNVWLPKAQQLREFVWFVKPEHRNTSIGGRLFLHYCNRADELLTQGKIQGYFTTRMITTDPIDLERRGFRLTERTYLKEH
jgi:hypothetical protein